MLWSVDDETVEAQQTPVVYSGVKHAEAWPSLNSRVLSFIQHIWPLQPSHSYHVSLNQAVQWQKLPPLLEELVDRPCAEKMKSTVYTRTSSSLSCPSFLLAHFFCLSLLFYALFSFPHPPTENRQNGCCAGLVCGSPEFRWLQQG